MSVESMSLVLHHSKAKGTAKLVLLGIANHEGDGGAWPTVATLARYANVTERAVQQAIAQLTSAGELYVQRQGGGTANLRDDQRPNLYRVNVACPWSCDHTVHHRLRDLSQLQSQLPLTPVDNGVKQASPGAGSFTPRGEAGFTQTVTTNPVPTVHRSVTGGGPTCTICSRSEFSCRQAQRATAAEDQHPFTTKALGR